MALGAVLRDAISTTSGLNQENMCYSLGKAKVKLITVGTLPYKTLPYNSSLLTV